ncbi:squalene/phytoene synthase family protein [Halodurantibacterium flavum]|uniref:Squalene/phytoene synthase family protein n=1 Tax=Halodurantibacterium flavum TaxID=1382802 RepID=A0ABW4SD02_9RHOB
MSVTEACADLVRQGDPDRFQATMAAPPGARSRLWPIYAFNLEVARAAWASAEPMIAEMRLQFWLDALDDLSEGRMPAGPEVLKPLSQGIAEGWIAPALLAGIVEARRWDPYREPFEDEAAFARHIDATAGNLMWQAAMALGADKMAEPVVRDFAFGSGVANWFLAVPELEARGRLPLVDGRPAAVATLARQGLAAIDRARAQRPAVTRAAAPALLAGWQAPALLRQAAASPERVAAGALGQSEFARRGSLLWRAVSGRW